MPRSVGHTAEVLSSGIEDNVRDSTIMSDVHEAEAAVPPATPTQAPGDAIASVVDVTRAHDDEEPPQQRPEPCPVSACLPSACGLASIGGVQCFVLLCVRCYSCPGRDDTTAGRRNRSRCPPLRRRRPRAPAWTAHAAHIDLLP